MRLHYALPLLVALATPPARAQSEAAYRCWVFFRDRPAVSESASPVANERALARRARRGDAALGARMDAGVAPAYLDALKTLGVEGLVESRWLNAVSARLTPEQREVVAALPFVRGVRAVARVETAALPPPVPLAETAGGGLDYGPSATQLALINADRALEMGYDGAGVRIGFLDTLFDFDHPALAHLAADGRLVAVEDFTGGQFQESYHGLSTSSVTFGRDDGDLVGPAHGAEAIAATTEYAPTETHAEEDFFIAGLEWMEANGADVVNVSLGYSTFDEGEGDYALSDLDGDTTPFTRAVDRAAALGVLVVVSAGNEGSSSWGKITAPADADSALAVAAVRPDSSRASFSGVGPSADGRIKPDLAAQGTDIRFAASDGTYRDFGSGTSFAAPLVTGVVGQLLQADPDLAPMDVIAILKATASQSAAPDTLLGWGIVNAEAALQRALTAEEPPPGAGALRVFPTVARSGGPLTVLFDAEIGAPVELALFDALGRRVATLLDGTANGQMTLTLPMLTAGSYLLRLVTDDAVATQRIAVVR